MSLEALSLGDRLRFIYLFANTENFPKNITETEKQKIRSIMRDRLDMTDWDMIRQWKPEIKIFLKKNLNPRRWQINAKKAYIESIKEKKDRFTTVAPCGSGKTFHGHRILNIKNKGDLFYKKTLVVVPNLHLLNQWFDNLSLFEPERNYILVGSDISVDKDYSIFDEEKEIEIPYLLTTDIETLKIKLVEFDENVTVISTYQSLDRLIQSCEEAKIVFDESIFDEAHVTCTSNKKSNFRLPLSESFPTKRRHFITATPKVCKGNDEVLDMDDDDIYGKRFTYSFNEAIEDDIISDYKICIGHADIETENLQASISLSARYLCQAVQENRINSVLICSNSHESSKRLYEEVEKIKEEYGISHQSILMKNGSNSMDKIRVVNKLKTGEPLFIFNVRVFSLGSDMPELQSVMLNGDRKSVIDIVQTVSRCLRKHSSKKEGYIIVPCLIDRTDEFTQKGSYQNVRRILASLGSVDSVLKETVLSRGGEKIKIDTIRTKGVKMERKVNDLEVKDFTIELYNRLCEHHVFRVPEHDYTSSKILNCTIKKGDTLISNKKKHYSDILRDIYQTMDKQQIKDNTICNISEINRKDSGYRWCEKLKLSIQGENANKMMKELKNMLKLNNYSLDMDIQLKNGKEIKIKL